MRYLFGPFAFDTAVRELRHECEPVHLTPRAFRLLEVLIESRPRAVAKEEIMARLWPGLFISEAAVASLVARVRRALDDDASAPRYVRTVHGFGYAFCGEASPAQPGVAGAAAPSTQHRLVLGTRVLALAPGENHLGRDRDCEVWLEDIAISRHHARIVIEEDRATLEDLGSKNGTFRSGERISGPVALADGDVVGLGEIRLTYRRVTPDAATETADQS
ncbi:MAG TPA: FHA domain-containing protein [Thermoanaerobaculia bacterium]|nr:FHA domain-containing protein [Thermoanaerobaculia bacterium]